MMSLAGKRVAIIATDYFEESELVEPLTQLKAMGATVDVLAPHAGTIKALRGMDASQVVAVDVPLEHADAEMYDGLIIPGGVVNADHLRIDAKAQEITKTIVETGKPVAAICHGPWLLVSCGLVAGRTLTSYPTLADDIRNAGGNWVDQEVVMDGNIITSRKPDDLPAFIQAFAQAIV